MSGTDASIGLWIRALEEAERQRMIGTRSVVIDASSVWRALVEQSDPRRVRDEIDGLLRSSAARIAQ